MKDISALQLDYKNYTLLKLEHEHILEKRLEQHAILEAIDQEVHLHEKMLRGAHSEFERDLDEMANKLFNALNTNNDGKIDLIEVLSCLFTDIDKSIIQSVSKTMLRDMKTSINFDRVKQCISELVFNCQ